MKTCTLQLQQVALSYDEPKHPMQRLAAYWRGQKPEPPKQVLQNINLELQAGQSLGVIGDNGAGKSSLLKVLAGILPPTQGQYRQQGRCSAILELASGLQMALSAEDNIRLGLALKGMNSQQIRRHLPQVLAFAELQAHAKQPLKSFSSGMLVRLAFAIVVQDQPDFLIVDEALSVGDQYFQKKSLDKMRSLFDAGAGLVFCSHNLYQVRELCQQAIWLEQGEVKLSGSAQQVVDAYQNAVRQRATGLESGIDLHQWPTKKHQPYLCAVQLNHPAPAVYQCGEHFEVRVKVDLGRQSVADVHVGIVIRRNDDVQCYGISTLHDKQPLSPVGTTQAGVIFALPDLPLLAGEYCLEVWLIDASGVHVYDARERCCPFIVQQADQNLGVGMCRLAHQWQAWV